MGKFVKTQELEAADNPLKISKVNVLAIENMLLHQILMLDLLQQQL